MKQFSFRTQILIINVPEYDLKLWRLNLTNLQSVFFFFLQCTKAARNSSYMRPESKANSRSMRLRTRSEEAIKSDFNLQHV